MENIFNVKNNYIFKFRKFDSSKYAKFFPCYSSQRTYLHWKGEKR